VIVGEDRPDLAGVEVAELDIVMCNVLILK
jgi:hypothetical protein